MERGQRAAVGMHYQLERNALDLHALEERRRAVQMEYNGQARQWSRCRCPRMEPLPFESHTVIEYAPCSTQLIMEPKLNLHVP